MDVIAREVCCSFVATRCCCFRDFYPRKKIKPGMKIWISIKAQCQSESTKKNCARVTTVFITKFGVQKEFEVVQVCLNVIIVTFSSDSVFLPARKLLAAINNLGAQKVAQWNKSDSLKTTPDIYQFELEKKWVLWGWKVYWATLCAPAASAFREDPKALPNQWVICHREY